MSEINYEKLWRNLYNYAERRMMASQKNHDFLNESILTKLLSEMNLIHDNAEKGKYLVWHANICDWVEPK